MKAMPKQSGYIGILLILLGTAGMIFLFMKMYFKSSPTAIEFQPNNAQGATPATQYDRLRSDIDTADAISNQLNTKALETNKTLNSIR
ncbi:MAG: hypothetical protein COZ48_02430 [Candidatus Yonathbacteria bacterium CG_4_10_14_3_um_filter_43_12]|uniref:Uncharacterized protein n=1 Tax=Candidatus Yonathbacteria bacterium CG_4_10_14_0_8_um_filter_43_17 TaxID=1975099 RepID=A0A2M7Q6A2_9BACT|nr:MAG: hypothetical protein COZ48_02430 [Candidatus Yonathbacteria bacterium CG_4_10_14_3_um_filter_43_12]PIY58600.1 MAG: hypothetical protein COY98_01280 [Candidatus Yonathbacteria bacterium CG_4_10_14_0_8_um_filter_43_17]